MRTRIIQVIVVGVVAIGLLIVGRLTAELGSGQTDGYQAGHGDGYYRGYSAGLLDGIVQGRQLGRADQVGESLPAGSRQPVKDAFNAGYTAGANDVFAGYDGGWVLSDPYVITLERGRSPIVYRIALRDPVLPGISYYLCPNGRDLCQEPRPHVG